MATVKENGWRIAANVPLRYDNRWLYEDEEKAEAMAEQLENQFRFVTTAPENIRGDVMEEIVKIDHAAIRDPPEIELRELQDVIKVMSSRKAPGEDGINNRAIKLMGVNATEGLLKIVNAIFKWASPQHLEIGNNGINSKRR